MLLRLPPLAAVRVLRGVGLLEELKPRSFSKRESASEIIMDFVIFEGEGALYSHDLSEPAFRKAATVNVQDEREPP